MAKCGKMKIPPFETSYQDIIDELALTEEAKDLICWWERKFQKYKGLQKFVKEFRHKSLYTITPENVLSVCDESSHALGQLPKEVDISVTRDAFTPYAMEYLFHGLLEHLGHLPTWDEFWGDMTGLRSKFWYGPMLDQCCAKGFERSKVEEGLRWRLGNSWQSGIREVFLISTLLHKYDIQVKYHILADVLLRVDGWYGNKLFYLRVENQMESRKKDPRIIFPKPNFLLHRVTIPHQGEGVVWLVPEKEIKAAYEFLLR